MNKTRLSLPLTLWACAGMTAALTPFFAPSPARADQQNLLPALTDDTDWVLTKQGQADATLGHNDEGMVVKVSAVDGQPAHVEVDHAGVALAEGRIYLLSFEGRSDQDEAFAVTVHAGTDAPNARSVGLDETVYLTSHWTPFRLLFTAHNVASGSNIVPQFLFGRQTGSVFLRNASLVQLASPPPPDAGLPDVIVPRKGETTLNGSLRSLLPDGRGCVMWVTSKALRDQSEVMVEPPRLQTVLWAAAQTFAAGKLLALTEVRVGDLVSVVGTSSGASFKARQIQISHRLETSPPAP
jgi:hypothetical protein